jgi:hypothetical protein
MNTSRFSGAPIIVSSSNTHYSIAQTGDDNAKLKYFDREAVAVPFQRTGDSGVRDRHDLDGGYQLCF